MAIQDSAPDWSNLLASVRRGSTSIDDGTTKAATTTKSSVPSDANLHNPSFCTDHFPALCQVLSNYATALCRLEEADEEADDEEEATEKGNNDTSQQHGSAPTKGQILEVRRALRFGMSCLAPPRPSSSAGTAENDEQRGNDNASVITDFIRAIQNYAVCNCQMHHPLIRILSSRNTDSKCRILAGKVLSNLVTSNVGTAGVIVSDIPLSALSLDGRLSSRLRKELPVDDPTTDEGETATLPRKSWVDMISASGRVGDREAVAAVIAALYNCVMSCSNDDEAEGNRDLPCVKELSPIDKDSGLDLATLADRVATDPLLFSNILRQMLPADSLTLSGDDDVADEGQIADAATEWISLLLEKLCRLGLLPNMYESAGSRLRAGQQSTSASSKLVTPEQIVFLHCIGRGVEESMHPSSNADGDKVTECHFLGGEGGEKALIGTHKFLAEEVASLRSTLVGAAGDKSSLEERYDGEMECRKSAHLSILEKLSTSLGSSGSDDSRNDGSSSLSTELRTTLGRETSILRDNMLDLGTKIDELSIRNRGRKARELLMSEEEQRLVTVYVRLIGNLCYKCRYNQDLLRETLVPFTHIASDNENTSVVDGEKECTGPPDASVAPTSAAVASSDPTTTSQQQRTGLHVLLSCTSFSFGCFTLREWSIVAIRNALENNLPNQRIVEKLEAQKPVQSPELESLGVEFDLDSSNGKVKVTRK